MKNIMEAMKQVLKPLSQTEHQKLIQNGDYS